MYGIAMCIRTNLLRKLLGTIGTNIVYLFINQSILGLFFMKLCTEMIVSYVMEYTTKWFYIILYFTQYVWKHIIFLCFVSIL